MLLGQAGGGGLPLQAWTTSAKDEQHGGLGDRRVPSSLRMQEIEPAEADARFATLDDHDTR